MWAGYARRTSPPWQQVQGDTFECLTIVHRKRQFALDSTVKAASARGHLAAGVAVFDRVCLSKVSGRCIPHHSQCHSVTVSLYHCYHQYLYQNHLHHYYYRPCYLCHYHHHGPVFCAFPKSYELRLVHNSTQLSTKCRRAWAWAWPVAGGGGGGKQKAQGKRSIPLIAIQMQPSLVCSRRSGPGARPADWIVSC